MGEIRPSSGLVVASSGGGLEHIDPDVHVEAPGEFTGVIPEKRITGIDTKIK